VGGDDFDGAMSWARRLGIPAPDIWTSFMVHDDKASVRSRIADKALPLKRLVDAGTRICQTVPIITQEDVPHAASFIGSFEHVNYLRWFFLTLHGAGAEDAELRLGHEMNGGHYPWAQLPPELFVKAFRVAAEVAHEELPKATAVWNPLRGSDKTKWWPGDQYVGRVGVDWYNNGGVPGVGYIADQATWDKAYLAGTDDEPLGWGRWLTFAGKHGKSLCVPEWGCGHGTGQGPSADEDTPGYVALIRRFFAANAGTGPGRLAWETYYNNYTHSIDPQAPFVPRFAKEYFARWVKG
jgi:hypothetical protein